MVTRILIKKTLRDIRSQWAQFLSVFVMAALTMLVFVGITSAGYGMQRSLNDYNASSAPADAWLTGKDITDDDLDAIRGMDTVSQAQAGITTSASIKDTSEGHDDPSVELNAVDRADIPKLDRIEGSAFRADQTGDANDASAPRDIWLDADLAQDRGWKPGDEIDLTIRGHASHWHVQGLVHSSEYLYPADPDTSVPDHSRLGFAYTGLDSLQTPHHANSYSTVRLRLNTPSGGDKADSVRTLEDNLRTRLGERFVSFSTRDSRPQTNSLQSRIDKVVKISALFSAIFALVALSTMLTSITRLVGVQRLQIAGMRALGISKNTLRLHYGRYGLLVCGLGAALGFAIAPFTVSKVLLHVYEDSYWLPSWQVSVKPVSWMVLAALVAICFLAAVAACGSSLRRAPAMELSDTSAQSNGSNPRPLIEHWSALWRRIPGNWRWTLRNMHQGKLRTLMGFLGSLGCMVLLCAGFGAQSVAQGMPDMLYGGQYSYQTKATIDPNATRDDTATKQVQDRVEHAMDPSTSAASSDKDRNGQVQWVEERPMEYRDDTSQSAMLNVVGPGSYMAIHDDQGKDIDLDQGAVLTKQAAQALHLKVGDELSFRTSSGKDYLRIPIQAIAYAPVSQGLIISRSTWTDTLGQSFTPTAALLGPQAKDQNIKDVDGVLRVTDFDRQKDGLTQSISSFTGIFAMLKLAALVLGLVVLYNLGVLNYSEEEREYAIMRVLGFKRSEIRSSVLRENCSLAVVGWLVGIPAAIAFLKIYLGAVASSTLAFDPKLSWTDLSWASMITLGCSLLVALLVSRRVKRIDMVQAFMSGE